MEHRLCVEASVVVALGPKSVWAPIVVAKGLWWLRGMWNSPGPEIKAVSPMRAGGFPSTGPLGKSLFKGFILYWTMAD